MKKLLILLAFLCVLGGCGIPQYKVIIINNTDKPVTTDLIVFDDKYIGFGFRIVKTAAVMQGAEKELILDSEHFKASGYGLAFRGRADPLYFEKDTFKNGEFTVFLNPEKSTED